MKRHTKIVLAVSVVALGSLAIVGTSVASKWRDHAGHHGLYAMHDGPGGHRGKRAMRMLKQFDTNNDDRLTQAEIEEVRDGRFATFDANGDGTLDLKEFEALWLETRRERMVDRFQRLDADGDAIVTVEEYNEPFENFVARFDRNGDGALSRDDRPRRGYRYQERYDDDDDDRDERPSND